MTNAGSRTRIFFDEVPHTLSPRNTDWRYLRYLLPRLVEWEPSLEIILQRSVRVSLQANWWHIRRAIERRIGAAPRLRDLEICWLDAAELKRTNASVVFSHRAYPVNAGDVPVVWQSSILDPAMVDLYYGKGDDRLAVDQRRRELFERAALVQVSTVAEAERLDRTFPEIAGRFVPVPFFLPALNAAPREVLEKHRSPRTVEILFVGNDAYRKGLDLLLEAFSSLPNAARQRAHLTVVSNFQGRKTVTVPDDMGITILSNAPHATVLDLMRRAHVLVNVARFESYGFIFPEAMSSGVTCIGPDWEVQRELLDAGRAGRNVACNAEQIRHALVEVIEDDALRHQLAEAAWTRFGERYSPAVVARQYAAMFKRAAGGNG